MQKFHPKSIGNVCRTLFTKLTSKVTKVYKLKLAKKLKLVEILMTASGLGLAS